MVTARRKQRLQMKDLDTRLLHRPVSFVFDPVRYPYMTALQAGEFAVEEVCMSGPFVHLSLLRGGKYCRACIRVVDIESGSIEIYRLDATDSVDVAAVQVTPTNAPDAAPPALKTEKHGLWFEDINELLIGCRVRIEVDKHRVNFRLCNFHGTEWFVARVYREFVGTHDPDVLVLTLIADGNVRSITIYRSEIRDGRIAVYCLDAEWKRPSGKFVRSPVARRAPILAGREREGGLGIQGSGFTPREEHLRALWGVGSPPYKPGACRGCGSTEGCFCPRDKTRSPV